MNYIGEIYHHGILGQKKGVRNGPPYPLSRQNYSAAEKKALAKDIHEKTLKKSLTKKEYHHATDQYRGLIDSNKEPLRLLQLDISRCRIDRENIFDKIIQSDDFTSKMDKYIEKRTKELREKGIEVDEYDFRNDLYETSDRSNECERYLRWLAKTSKEYGDRYKEVMQDEKLAIDKRNYYCREIIDDLVGEYKTVPAKIPFKWEYKNGKMQVTYKQASVEDFLRELIIDRADEYVALSSMNF